MARLKISTPKFKAPAVGNKKRLVLASTTLCCALGIGYVTQFGLPGQPRFQGPVAVENIALTSSVMMPKPGLPEDGVTDAAAEFTTAPQPREPMVTASVAPDVMAAPAASPASVAAPAQVQPPAVTAEAPACDVTLDAEPTAGAMVNLTLDAPCHLNERVTLHHNGMMFTEITDTAGMVKVTVPVLAEKAVFVASFAGGDGASATSEVNSLSFYDRVVVQWKGAAGLQLHAREFDAGYFADGHVWAAEAGDLSNAARGEGGFLMRLGREDTPEALIAEVYSYPTGTSKRSGDVQLSVEAEVTDRNCGSMVEAQTFELTESDAIEVHDLVLNIPACDAVGDFLVLKNLLQDLTIAGR